MREIYFYDDKKVAVTNHRFIIGNETYAMHHITSVKRGETLADRGLPSLITLAGFAIIAYDLYRLFKFGTDFKLLILGVLVLLIGITMFLNSKDEYSVIIKTSAGEDQPVSHTSKDYIDEIVQALNTSIVSRR